MARIPAVALSLALATAGLSGCALFEDLGGGDLDDALELVPGEAASVRFVHREAMAERLGIDDIAAGASRKDTRRYVDTLLEDGLTGATSFAQYLDLMARDAAFSELDIVWAATSTRGDDGISLALPRIYRLRDDLDLEDVGDDLVETGYSEDEIDGHPHYSIDPMDTEFDGMLGSYPALEMMNVVLVPDEHLMFVGGSRETVELAVEVFEDDTDSMTDAGTFDGVLDGADDPEYAALVAEPECSDSGERGAPDAAAFFISGAEGDGIRVLEFADGTVVSDDYRDDDFEAC